MEMDVSLNRLARAAYAAVEGGSDLFTVDKKDMTTLVSGACVLASGGGGSFQVACEIIDQGIGADDRVSVISLDELAQHPDGWLATSANMGAPDALFRTTNPHAPANAFRAMESELHMMRGADPRFAHFPPQGFSWVLPIEVGAINSASPLTVAAQLDHERQGGLAVIDADGAGRSIPTLSLTVFAANAISAHPAVVASEGMHASASGGGMPGYNTGVIRVDNETAAEEAIIGLVMSAPFGGIAGMSMYPLTASGLLQRTPPVGGTLSLALAIGRVLESCDGAERAAGVVSCIRNAGRASAVIWHGRVCEVVQAEGGVDVGRIVLDDAGGSGARLTIYNENENVFAIRSDQDMPCVMGPDSICYVTVGNAPLAVDNSDLNRLYQQAPDTRLELFIVAVEAAVEMRNSVIISNFCAVNRSLGYAGKYVPWSMTGAARSA